MNKTNRVRLNQVQLEMYHVQVKDEMEQQLQWEAVYNLVTNNLRKIDKQFKGELMGERLVAMINHQIKININEWCAKYPNKPSLAKPSIFYFSMKIDCNSGDLVFDHFPDILTEMEEGTSNIRLWYPTQQELMNAINYQHINQN